MSRQFLVPIVLPADPVAAMEAATKQYVDANVGGGGGLPAEPIPPKYLTLVYNHLTDAVEWGYPYSTLQSILPNNSSYGTLDWAYCGAVFNYTSSGATELHLPASWDSMFEVGFYSDVVKSSGSGTLTITADEDVTINGVLGGSYSVPLGVLVRVVMLTPTVWWASTAAAGGGVEEVAVQAADPGIAYDLWYDTDDPGVSYANMPRGFVAEARLANDVALGGAPAFADVAGLSVTWTADPTRRYHIYARLGLLKYTAVGSISCVIADSSNNNIDGAVVTLGINEYATVLMDCHYQGGLSGSITRKIRVHNGTIGASVLGGLYASNLVVEDVGGV